MNPKRARRLNTIDYAQGPLLYWMDRDRRAHDNWALLYAQEMAKKHGQALAVCYVFPETFLDSAWRQHHFMIEGLKEVEEELRKKGIPFFAILGDPIEELPKFIQREKIGGVVTDFTPLRLPRKWRESIAKQLKVPMVEVDTRNIVPVWEASPKLEFGAYTLRPKIHKKLDEFLEEFPKLAKHSPEWQKKVKAVDWAKVEQFLEMDRSVEPVDWIKPGEKAAHRMLKKFLEQKLPDYEKRNDPNEDVLSNLSPYLHFGMISAQRVALEAQAFEKNITAQESFLEELIVRRELADNFCFYNPNYDTPKGFPDWAKKTLDEHRGDDREFVYTLKEFEEARTHDPLWNACQRQMLQTGKMHGYMRMYWGKKILEWTKSPEEAMKIAINLNDKWELDGRDSNGYVGIAWSIGGVHDRAWGEREVFGKVRYMNDKGAKRKFDVEEYVGRWGG
ncbi:MAG: deoxyribodipyrimidine photo-lyase [Candidatus Altimarinota bacterium]